MSPALVMCLLPLKHVLLAHAFDIGYSAGRSLLNRFWYIHLTLASLLEVAATGIILLGYPPQKVSIVLTIEFISLWLGACIERRARKGKELKTHLVCEMLALGMLAGHAVFVSL